jgi:hypothetical protein
MKNGILAALFAVAASGMSVDECSGSFFIAKSLLVNNL